MKHSSSLPLAWALIASGRRVGKAQVVARSCFVTTHRRARTSALTRHGIDTTRFAHGGGPGRKADLYARSPRVVHFVDRERLVVSARVDVRRARAAVSRRDARDTHDATILSRLDRTRGQR